MLVSQRRRGNNEHAPHQSLARKYIQPNGIGAHSAVIDLEAALTPLRICFRGVCLTRRSWQRNRSTTRENKMRNNRDQEAWSERIMLQSG